MRAPEPRDDMPGTTLNPARRTHAGWLTVIGAAILMTGCQKAVRWDESAAPRTGQTAGSTTGRSSRGNPPFYEVFGERYYVLDSSAGFSERGVASWYGKKFHGRPTSSGVIYDMHGMTAAHKTLPLPTRVRVRNLTNGRSVIVLVNDRGPFVDNRIIDLSYAAAKRLDMIRAGTAMVEIEALTETPRVTAAPVAAPQAEPVRSTDVHLFLQVGAFGERANAQQLLERLRAGGFANAVIRTDTTQVAPIYRVRLGPITDVAEYDALVAKMATLAINETHLVTEAGSAAGG